MYANKKTCIIPAFLIGAALGYLYSDKMELKKDGMNIEPMIIFPRGMEKKAKTIMKHVHKAWEEIV
ncbi:MAG: hypothetical protein RSB05_07270 [Clostridiales bacterium]